MKKAIAFKNVKKNYGQLKAVNGFSVELKKGEVVGLLGPNGAGKSTLMKILTGYYKEWEGEISYDGLDVKDIKMQTSLGVPQEVVFDPFFN